MIHHRRYKREKAAEKFVPLAPSYELVLSHDEPPHIDSTLSVTVEEGQTLRLKCTAGEGIDEQTLKFERELEEIHGKRTPRSVSQHIFNFEDATHSGLYECFARTSSGEEHSRKMRVSTKAVLPGDFVPCPNGDDYCGANGRCGMKNEDKICVCDPGYVGQQCEHLLVKDYLITTAKVVAGAGGTLNVALIFLTVLFATLFIKESIDAIHHSTTMSRRSICFESGDADLIVHPPTDGWTSPGHDDILEENVYDSCDLNNSTQWKSRHFSLNHRIPTTSQTQVVEKKCISKDHTPSINPFIVPRALQLFGDSVSLSEIACRLNQVEFLRKHHPSRNHLPSHHLA